MKRPETIRVAVLALLAVLSLTGVLSSLHNFLFLSPARGITAVFEERAERYQQCVYQSRQAVLDLKSDSTAGEHRHLMEPLSDALEFASFAVSASIVAVHVINIYLILSKPAGLALLSILFILLTVLQFVQNDRRLRNISMAVGTAAFVFIIAIPSSVILSGRLSLMYTSTLRQVTTGRMEAFSENGDALLERVAEEGSDFDESLLRTEIIVLVKGTPRYVWFGSASWLLDLALLPLGLSWLLYQLGILIANTVFGSFRMQKIGETLRRVFQKFDNS